MKSKSLKTRKINVIDSSVSVLWKPINCLDNIPKYSYGFPTVFYKMNIFLLSSLSNMIIDSGSRWVGGSLVGGSAISEFSKTQEKLC